MLTCYTTFVYIYINLNNIVQQQYLAIKVSSTIVKFGSVICEDIDMQKVSTFLPHIKN